MLNCVAVASNSPGTSHFPRARAKLTCVCNFCKIEWPRTAEYFPPKYRGSTLLSTRCRACNNNRKQREPGKRSVPERAEHSRAYFASRIGTAGVHIDIQDVCMGRGVSPGHGPTLEQHKARLLSEGLTRRAPRELPVEQLVARHVAVEARKQAAEALNKEPSRQQRRATERGLNKLARATERLTRPMTDSEVYLHAARKDAASRRRAKGGRYVAVRVRRGVRWAISPEQRAEKLKAQGYRCALTGEPFKLSREFGKTNPFAPSPNRINPGGDYTLENLEYVCWWCNRAISDMPRQKAVAFLRERGLLRLDFVEAPG